MYVFTVIVGTIHKKSDLKKKYQYIGNNFFLCIYIFIFIMKRFCKLDLHFTKKKKHL